MPAFHGCNWSQQAASHHSASDCREYQWYWSRHGVHIIQVASVSGGWISCNILRNSSCSLNALSTSFEMCCNMRIPNIVNMPLWCNRVCSNLLDAHSHASIGTVPLNICIQLTVTLPRSYYGVESYNSFTEHEHLAKACPCKCNIRHWKVMNVSPCFCGLHHFGSLFLRARGKVMKNLARLLIRAVQPKFWHA